jgi:hypothetical protein
MYLRQFGKKEWNLVDRFFADQIPKMCTEKKKTKKNIDSGKITFNLTDGISSDLQALSIFFPIKDGMSKRNINLFLKTILQTCFHNEFCVSLPYQLISIFLYINTTTC